ncbi:potassium/proton antiporter [Oceanobacillus damuensis]|uniref:potassium/proton antiporter n=1 Tax=Oceanobacillus damuensis TaxID=937928 RepID=UPI000AF2A9F7|nr:potassium/proton antiporter [Oceanobacillus damuensis]
MTNKLATNRLERGSYMIPELIDSNLIILIFSVILILSILGTKFTSKVNTPSLLFFIALGMVIGNDGLNIFAFYDAEMAQLIGMMALVIILFDGGIKTNWKSIKPVAIPSISLATLGVTITSFILGIAAKLLFTLNWPEALLMGALAGSTDAAAVFAMMQGKNINDRLEATLEAESGANDPMAVFLTVTLISFVEMKNSGVLGLIGSFLWNMGGGLLIGLLIGWFGSKALHRITLNSSGLYPLHALAFAFLAYSGATLVNASGLLAVYAAAIYIGNTGLKQRNAILQFNEGFSWIAQIVLFITLGLFVIPSDLFQWEIMWKALLLSFILMFVARPIASFISVVGMDFNIREKLLISWAGLRGAVPIVLALFPMLSGLEHSQLFFNVIFFVVLTSTLLQGTTISLLADKLGLVKPGRTTQINHMELLSIGKNNLEIVEIIIDENSFVVGEKIKDLGLPPNANITFILRDGETLSPNGDIKIMEGDLLYILAPEKDVDRLEEILNE